MKPVDRDALQRAMEMARASDPLRSEQLDSKLKDERWEEVARFAAYCCQTRTLKLRPWQPAPCHATIKDEDNALGPIGGRKAAATLLKRMFAAGLSRYEPDPLGALDRVEAQVVARGKP